MDDRLNKKQGGKPSNAELIAERKAIRELLEVQQGVSTLEAVAALKAQREQLLTELKAAVHSAGAGLADAPFVVPLVPRVSHAPMTTGPFPNDPGPPMPPRDAPEIEQKPRGVPVDTAVYPGFNDHRVSLEPLSTGQPAMSPVHGDLTPAYVRWLLVNSSPAAVRERYKNREHLLPEDVRGALA